MLKFLIIIGLRKEGVYVNCRWNTDKLDNLYDNYTYYKNHKEEAIRTFGCSWNAIALQASLLCCNKQLKSNINILQSLEGYISGLLLSDGSLKQVSMKSGLYYQRCKYYIWLDSIIKKFFEYGIKSIRSIGELRYISFGVSYDYKMWTSSYIEFNELYNDWYMKDYNVDEYSINLWKVDDDSEWYVSKKIVPRYIELTPECVANWYMGDGDKDKYDCIKLSTQSFSIDEVEFLSELLNNTVDIRSVFNRKNRCIYISKSKDIPVFIDYVKGYIISCYDYKIDKWKKTLNE